MNCAFPARDARALTGAHRLFAAAVYIHNKYFGEHGGILEVLDGSTEDALLEVHLHAEVLAHLGGCVVALGGVDVEAETVYERESLVLAPYSFV